MVELKFLPVGRPFKVTTNLYQYVWCIVCDSSQAVCGRERTPTQHPSREKGKVKPLPVQSPTCLTFCSLDEGFQCSVAWDTLLGKWEYSLCRPFCGFAPNDIIDSQALNEFHKKYTLICTTHFRRGSLSFLPSILSLWGSLVTEGWSLWSLSCFWHFSLQKIILEET